MSKVLSLFVPALALAATTLYSPDADAAGVKVVIGGPAVTAPPPLARVWIPGHYEMKAGRRVWVRSHFKIAPALGKIWAPGHWKLVRGKRVWVNGSWR